MPSKFDTNWNLSPVAVTLGAATHNLTPGGLDAASVIWITPLATIDLTGLAGGEEGRIMFLGLRTSFSFSVNILANSAFSLPQNQFADALILNASGVAASRVCSAWIYLGARWRRWKY